jgi:hypothetical protein
MSPLDLNLKINLSRFFLMAMLYAIVRNGWAAVITEDVRQVTGNQPKSFAEYAKQSANHGRNSKYQD